jgi:hypothetical protein
MGFDPFPYGAFLKWMIFTFFFMGFNGDLMVIFHGIYDDQ